MNKMAVKKRNCESSVTENVGQNYCIESCWEYGNIFVEENVWKSSLRENVFNTRFKKYGAIVSCAVRFPASLSRTARKPKATEQPRIVKPHIQNAINLNIGVGLTI
jgi:hypothetical protein